MSGSSYYKTQDEWSADCDISPRMLRKYISNFHEESPKKRKSGWPKKECQEFVAMAKREGLQGDGSVKDAKTLKEIELLEIRIEKADVELQQSKNKLVNRIEEEARFKAEWANARMLIESWRSYQSAKAPNFAQIIDELADSLINMIHDS